MEREFKKSRDVTNRRRTCVIGEQTLQLGTQALLAFEDEVVRLEWKMCLQIANRYTPCGEAVPVTSRPTCEEKFCTPGLPHRSHCLTSIGMHRLARDTDALKEALCGWPPAAGCS